ncbi:helix-turn-helix transcriptional regulator [Paenibacillus rigui]|uniref:AraC family transcriptional regulator n=1 Tax=Paenibacillus rigui TaxID=554312 RepID=A0A229URG5_9BACL|nr:AraC family transcriptional regulator [Paenibacillus rigui]OXM85785.1 AraC family transcriptional regulator [Paenibacillus rigui]
MKKTWYHRLLLSYFPILFVTVGIIVFLSVSMLSEFSISETEKANRIFVKYVIDSMETSLKGVERVILEETGNSDAFYHFFEMKDTDDAGLVYYETSKEIHKILDDNPLLQSVYLYRAKDQEVLTINSLEKLDTFPDKAYVLQALQQPAGSGWSGVRSYSGLTLQPPEQVISMSKKALLPFGNQGIIVVNVRVDQLLRIVDEMMNPSITFMNIADAEGAQVYPVTSAKLTGQGKEASEGSVVTNIYSKLIGWTFVSGIRGGRMFSWVSTISHMWISIGVLTILFSLIYTVYVTRRNYKPIERIMQQIHAHQSRNQLKGSDEFSFIGKVLENLIDQTGRYEKQYQEDLIVRRKQFFQELISSRSSVSEKAWAENMPRFKLPDTYTNLQFGTAEIDGFAAFQTTYSVTDQNLLKFALTNVVQEFSDPEWLTVWAEWISEKRLAILFIVNAPALNEQQNTMELLDRFRIWVAVNLKFSMTVGVGRNVASLAELGLSFSESISALEYKMSLGNNQVICYEELRGVKSVDSHKYYQRMDALSQDFRLEGTAWQLQVDELVHDLEQDLLKEVEIRHLLQYWMRMLQRMIELLPGEYTAYWNDKFRQSLTEAIETIETAEELLPIFADSLKQMHKHYLDLRESKSHHSMLSDMRKYIEDNYANPDLSLNMISDEFGINAKYASHLFKEAYGMKFVDFLMNLRMEEAKKLLLASDASLQDISEKVGYTHAISFGRTFKKVVGVTPGDYRKYTQIT